jgi:hypothetical protein
MLMTTIKIGRSILALGVISFTICGLQTANIRPSSSSSNLCANLSVLSVSAVTASLRPLNRRDAGDAEVAQRRVSKKTQRTPRLRREFTRLQQQSSPTTAPTQNATPPVDEWGDEFDGDKLDETKWEVYTFEGGGSSKVEVKDKLLKMRGAGATRSGIRSKQLFHTDRFYVEAMLAKVGPQLPQPGAESYQAGYAILTVLFDGTATNRLEWILRSDGMFEAWSMIDGKSERLDNRKLGTKEKNPHLGIARRGDQVYFMLNREIGLQQTVRNLSQNFKVMLYGFGSTENSWDSIYVQTPKQ